MIVYNLSSVQTVAILIKLKSRGMLFKHENEQGERTFIMKMDMVTGGRQC